MHSTKSERVHFRDLNPPVSDMRREVLQGLLASPKFISSRYFYDRNGSRLFEEITRLPEYYPTLAEISILERLAPTLKQRLGERVFLIEYGSGSSRKVRILLEPLRPVGYMPVDISGESLLETALELAGDYPWLSVYPTCADYCTPLQPVEEDAVRLAFFPGSSIGNLEPDECAQFLGPLHQSVGPGGYLLIGVDRIKNVEVLEAAYNDAAGVTAEFNLNILHHLNRRLAGELVPEHFRHKAIYNAASRRVEMYLVCVKSHTATLADERIHFLKGEEVLTEYSYKYSRRGFTELVVPCGFEAVADWSDTRNLFSVFLFRAV